MYYHPPVPPQPENTSKELWKVLRLQLLIFAGYQFLFGLICWAMKMDGFIILDIFPLIAHWLILLILMIVSFARGKKGAGLGYLISLLISGIIGFGSCFLIASLIGSSLYGESF